MLITIDGAIAAGKTTLAKTLAAQLGFDRFDYEAAIMLVAQRVYESDADEWNSWSVEKVVTRMSFEPDDPGPLLENLPRIRDVAAIIAQYQSVRDALMDRMLLFCKSPPGGNGAVIDGRFANRDFPYADLKFFLRVTPKEAAFRRHHELLKAGQASASMNEIHGVFSWRQQMDDEGRLQPLTPAPDSVQIDTTRLDAKAVSLHAHAAARVVLLNQALVAPQAPAPFFMGA